MVDAGVAGTPVDGTVAARPRDAQGDLVEQDALSRADVDALLARGARIGGDAATRGLVALGEVGVANTTVGAALAGALLGLDASAAVGLGSGSDAEMLERKRAVVAAAIDRVQPRLVGAPNPAEQAVVALETLGGPEIALLTGVVLGAAAAGSPIVLDGLCGSLPALIAVRMEPGVQAYLVAGQQSRETAHAEVLRELGLEPLLSLRMRAGEGVGAVLASSMVLQGLTIRRMSARTVE